MDIIIAIIGAVGLAIGGFHLTCSVLWSFIIFICGFFWALIKIHEGASRGSGYRQEKNQEAILEELRKQNDK